MRAFTLAESGAQLHPRFSSVAHWPWTWARVASYVRQVKNIYQRAAMDENPKTAMPPRSKWFDGDWIDDWFKSRSKRKKRR